MSDRNIVRWPKHKNPVDSSGKLKGDRTASAPYNFVPLPEDVVTAVGDVSELPDHSHYDPERHTGYFEVKLITKSPLYVRCPYTREEFDLDEQRQNKNGRKIDNDTLFANRIKNTPHFFYTRDPNNPVIPGSSLRGMLRSLLEIVSYGKVQWVTKKQLIYRAVGDPTSFGQHYRDQFLGANKAQPPDMRFDYPGLQIKGGYLHRAGNDWAIQPAKEIQGETFVHVEYTAAQPIIGWHGRHLVHDVFVKPAARISSNRGPRGSGNLTLDLAVTARISNTAAPGLVAAKLVESGHMRGSHPKHWHCAIFERDRSAAPILISPEMWEIYKEDADVTPRKLTADGDPLFYLLDSQGRLVYFGTTMMFRLPYNHQPIDLVPRELRLPEDTDYADAIFGYVRTDEELRDMEQRHVIEKIPDQGEKRRAYAGRVFVTDASLIEGQSDTWLSPDPIVPKILATPKPTAFQHYLVQEKPDRYPTGQLRHYDSPDGIIRGSKRYWHQGLNPDQGLTLEQIQERIENDREAQRRIADTSKQHTQFKPIKPGIGFAFRVYFENLSDHELGALCWTLHPLGDQAKEYCHHLGMGKPLGMGSVKLDATLHLTNRPERYSSLFNSNDWQTGNTRSQESLSNRATLERRTKEFEEHVLTELKLFPQHRHLFEAKRIGMLLKMMEWPGFRAVPPIPGQSAPNNNVIEENGKRRPNTRYMMIELPGVGGSKKNEYRDRPVLPDPSAFGALTGDAEPPGAR
jgi:CRISPR-associated protein (TIGR03986 family)